ncbi:MAG: 30S ribosome-binding factor RbfA [Pseudomonadota bacterium]
MARRPASPAEPSQRQLRAGELIRHALVDVLAREDLRDPALQGVSITIGEVRCSPDLKHARVFCAPLGNSDPDHATSIAEGLNRASAFLRGRLGKEIDLKFTPQLRFIADDSYNEATAINRLFDDPKVRQDLSTSEEDN